MKKAVIVVGMHRSGTSAMMGCLKTLGVDLGPGKMDGNRVEKLFEDKDLQRCNISILRAYGTDWKDIDPLKPSLKNSIINRGFKNSVKYLIAKKFKNSEYFSFKDPRMCLLLPLYIDVFNKLGVKDRKFIFMRRPAEEIVKSLERRGDTNIPQAGRLVAKYIKRVENGLKGESVLEVNFSDLVNREANKVSEVYKFVFGKEIENELKNQAYNFVDPKKKHF